MPLPDYMGPTYRPGVAPERIPSRRERMVNAVRQLIWPPQPRLWAGLFAAALALLGSSGLGFYARLSSRLPSDTDWSAAAALLEREARPGDAVALAPMWAERARLVLPASIPVMSLPRYGPEEELVGVRRVWLVSLAQAPGFSRDIERDLAGRAAGRDGPQHLGALEVTRYDLRDPLTPLAWLPDRLAEARVRVGREPCRRDASGVHRCLAPPWVYVDRQVREVSYLPRPCLWAHPNSSSDAPLTIEFPDVPMGRLLAGHTGIVGSAMLDGNAPVVLEVKLDGDTVGVFQEPPRTPGWHRFQIDTASSAGRRRTVSFTITAADPTRRHFCFEAMTL
jgi:hypothetical protein